MLTCLQSPSEYSEPVLKANHSARTMNKPATTTPAALGKRTHDEAASDASQDIRVDTLPLDPALAALTPTVSDEWEDVSDADDEAKLEVRARS